MKNHLDLPSLTLNRLGSGSSGTFLWRAFDSQTHLSLRALFPHLQHKFTSPSAFIPPSCKRAGTQWVFYLQRLSQTNPLGLKYSSCQNCLIAGAGADDGKPMLGCRAGDWREPLETCVKSRGKGVPGGKAQQNDLQQDWEVMLKARNKALYRQSKFNRDRQEVLKVA